MAKMLEAGRCANPDIPRGRPVERSQFIPNGDGPLLTLRKSSLSQEDENEVFEDARETWDPEPTSTTIRSSTLGVLSSINTENSQMNGVEAQEELRLPCHDHEDEIPFKSAHPRRAVRGNMSIGQEATMESYFGAPRGLFNGSQAQHWQMNLAVPSPKGLSLTIPPSEGHSHRSHERSRSITPSIAPSAVNEDISTRYNKECEACKKYFRSTWYCNVCKFNFCDACWDSLLLHQQPPRQGHGQTPHERTDPTIAEKVQKAMVPPVDEWAREQLYKDDEVTSWFGIERPNDFGPPVFQDYGRFAELMASTDPLKTDPGNTFVENTRSLHRDKRTPSLVSFVGQTGAGKSTLVKLLIKFSSQDLERYSSPVVGPPGAHLPTSEDVHLYMDPQTAGSQGPLLYADCEGLEGGEREPLGAKFRKKRQKDMDPQDKNLKSSRVLSERELRWANGPLERSREFAVTNLYPRLLYTFSDVIVFVLRNPRVVEHVFERLITWAAAAIETSSNQPVLPHAIIVLNASENDLHEKLWDVPANTGSILDDLARTVNRNETFKRWAQFWRERGKEINTLTDLVLCYYSSIQILRIPQHGRPKLMQEQVEKLYSGTLTASIASRSARNRLRMLLDVEDLQEYLQEAFSHYTSTLDSPFDFVQASFRNSPIPPDFGGNILKLALNVMDILQFRSDSITEGQRIFAELAIVVASCIMLDNARHNTKGNAEKIFKNYMNHLDDALENFCEHHWPCEFVNSRQQRCVNVRVGHQSKGHQSKDGKVIAAGDYSSKFSFMAYFKPFRDLVYSCLVALLDELVLRTQDGRAEEAAAAAIHKEMVMTKFYARIAAANNNLSADNGFLHSHSACFCCLFGQAQVPLPCGHILCTPCLTTYGRPNGETGYDIDGCPIEGSNGPRLHPWRIQLKPKLAGVRILTLDGGGVRGIVELETLRRIEKALGDLPIQCFFDLIVGTSTGGLVALGLTAMNWSVEECTENFEKLCGQAFTMRSGGGLPIFGTLVENYHHSKYQTSTLEAALRTAFSEDLHLFGGRCPAELCASSVKVAVTATSLAANKTYLLSNYNRPEPKRGPGSCHFQRPERIDHELKIWEAARATSAAPRFFKSFHHEMSQKTYIDGAIHHNNPCRVAHSERKALWPEIDVPDVFVSLGTGSSISLEEQESERMRAAKKGFVSHGLALLNILKKNMEAALDCDRIWQDYIASAPVKFQPGTLSRYHRINPRIEGKVPELDEKDKIGQLRRSAFAALKRDHEVECIARQLLASTFYFQLSSISDGEGFHFVQGKIMCRLPQPSSVVGKLGQHLHRAMIEHGELSFVVWEESGAQNNLQHMDRQALSLKVIEKMICEQRFDMERFVFRIRDKVLPTHINLCFGNMTMMPISGFPKSLLLSTETHNSGARSPQAFLSEVNRASSRYTHGSRRQKRVATWEPPSFPDSRIIPDLRKYGDPARAIGSHDVDQLLPEVVVPDRSKQPDYSRTHAFGNWTGTTAGTLDTGDHLLHYSTVNHPPNQAAPAPRQVLGACDPMGMLRVAQWVDATAPLFSQRPQEQFSQKPQEKSSQRPQEQVSTRTTLRNAFRALLWPIRAHPGRINNVFPEDSAEDTMSFVHNEDEVSFLARGFSPYGPDTIRPAVELASGPLTMQYYHVDSAENEIYQQWVNVLTPSMGQTWGCAVSSREPDHGASSWLAPHPHQPQLQQAFIHHEMDGKSCQIFELPVPPPRVELSSTPVDSLNPTGNNTTKRGITPPPSVYIGTSAGGPRWSTQAVDSNCGDSDSREYFKMPARIHNQPRGRRASEASSRSQHSQNSFHRFIHGGRRHGRDHSNAIELSAGSDCELDA